MTLADFSAACELAQVKATNIESIIKDYPKVHKWLERMLTIPEFKEIHDYALPMLK